ncbi:MAG: DUF5034 domain-containing protein [Chitinophagales bacterium]|nr:DUF5034 domain-containing protein [Chitinophagaceae bacterium]MCB9064369.1 DUF5034 domain-containing protein [Chitinophagales bacterium]
MLKSNNLLLSLFTGLLYVTLSGCCGCSGISSYCVNINGTSFIAMNNSDSVARVASNEVVPGLALALDLNVSNDIKVCYTKPRVYFGNAAYATSCSKDEYVQSDSISHVSIIADKDYDSAHPQGAELNDLFYKTGKVRSFNHQEESKSFLYYAQKAPEQSNVFVFTAKLTFDNGQVVESKSQPVNLSK